MKRVFIVYYDFGGTSGNHAGMTHLVKFIAQNDDRVRLIKSIPHHYKMGRFIAQVYAVLLAFYFKLVLKKGNKVFFFEYLTKGTAYQALTVKCMRGISIHNTIYALIHLSGEHLLETYKSKKYILDSLQPVDKLFVFGSSLAKFLKNLGFQKEIITTFHYVDTDYYKPAEYKPSNPGLQVICMGGLKRDFSLLQAIVSALPHTVFHVLMGKKNLRPFFKGIDNVKLYPFLSEPEMLQLMQTCDVSVSVMEDTIGSNVITTSLAVGLAQVVSDVGSIRDYCDESNSFLCRTKQDFLDAIDKLDKDRNLLKSMREAALQKAAAISHKAFIRQFKELIWQNP